MVALETRTMRIRIQQALHGPAEFGDRIVVSVDILEPAPPAQVPRVVVVRPAVNGNVRIHRDDRLDLRSKCASVYGRLGAVGETDEADTRAVHLPARLQV